MSTYPAARTRRIRRSFGQPRGLATLFLTEMWERFTYYGMRSILILYAVAAVSDGGLGLDDRNASSIYGLYIAATYVFALFGGWMADRLLGAQRAVIIGGVCILCGNALLVLGSPHSFFCRPRRHRARRGAPEAQYQRHGGRALSGRRRAARCRLLDLLRRYQRRCAARLSPRAAVRCALRLAVGIRPAGRRHGARTWRSSC